MTTSVSAEDRILTEALARWPEFNLRRNADLDVLLRRAEHHGLAGLVHDALARLGGPIDRELTLRETARDLDHHAHVAALHRLDSALSAARLRAVALKGALFAERFYSRPSARVTGDIDLMVEEQAVESVASALAGLGYVASFSPDESWYRRDHHHLHFTHPAGLPLELHFHAYLGFGGILPSEPLIERSRLHEGFGALRVLAPEDEIVYLAVHAAAHRFGRLSWLFDLRLLVAKVSDDMMRAARGRASELGFERPLSLAARLLGDIFAMDRSRLALLGELDPVRAALIERLIPIPRSRLLRAASHFAYSTALCPDFRASIRCISRELRSSRRSIFTGT